MIEIPSADRHESLIDHRRRGDLRLQPVVKLRRVIIETYRRLAMRTRHRQQQTNLIPRIQHDRMRDHAPHRMSDQNDRFRYILRTAVQIQYSPYRFVNETRLIVKKRPVQGGEFAVEIDREKIEMKFASRIDGFPQRDRR